jgi:Protein similar to CwfJ C-terminus 1
MQRDEWMKSEFDIFKSSERGPNKSEIKKKEENAKRQEIQEQRQVKMVDKKSSTSWGDKGSNWRMIKLKRVYEIAAEEKRPLEQVAIDRYGSLEDFQDAINERDYLDSKMDKSGQSSASSSSYRAPVRKSQFKAPESKSSLRQESKKPNDTVVAEVKKQQEKRKTVKLVAKTPVLSTDELNKLSAQVIKAKLMKKSNLDKLEEEFEYELERARTQKDVIVINEDDDSSPKHKRNKVENVKTHDKDGNVIEHDDSSRKTLHDLLREEKMDSESHYDRDMAHQISKDSRFEDDLEYLEESTDNLSRGKRREGKKSKYSERGILYNKDKARKEAELDECPFCYHEETAPRVSVVSVGIKAYLALPETIDMVPFHCFIVPMNHATSTLELDDDVWDEIRVILFILI